MKLLEKTDRILIIGKFIGGDSVSEGRIEFPVTLRVYYFRVRRPSPYKRSVLMILSVLCLLSGVLGVNAVKLHAKNTAYKQQEAELKTQIKSEQARAEEIKEYEQYVQTDDYMKEIAEDKLNLVDPNEIVFKPIK